MATTFENRLYPLVIDQGDCEQFLFRYKDDSGNPIDLSTYGAEMVVSWGYGRNPIDNSVIAASGSFTVTSAAGISVNEAGEINVSFTAAQTTQIPYSGTQFSIQAAEYQLRLTKPDGCKETILAGPLVVFRNKFNA